MAVGWRAPRETAGTPLLRPWMAPPVIPGLVARKALSERLLDVAPGGTVVLRGGAGYGKTSLATWLCHRRETRERFSGGLLWVTLGGHVAGAALAERINELVERLTGVRPTFTEAAEAGARLGSLLDGSPEPLLLVIDDATEAQLAPFRSGGKHCRRLVTTTEAGDGIDVGPMEESEARRLLLRDLPGDLAPGVVERLLSRTRRWPLPLALANRAAMRSVRHGDTPESALRRIADRESIVQAGLDLLPPSYADRFAELAIFAPHVEIPLEILHPLWGGRFGEVARICAALADLSLVLRGRPGTIRLHDVIRDHLVSTTDPAKRVALHRRLLDSADRWRDDYLIAHLAEHLAAADRRDELNETLTDPRRTLLRLQTHGPAAVAADLAYGETPEARTLARVIRRDCHLLGPTDPPDALGAVLASRLDRIPAPNDRTWLVNRPAAIPAVAGTNRLITTANKGLSCVIDGPFAVAHDGTWLAHATHHHIDVWDIDADRLRTSHPAPAADARIMTLAPDDDSLVVCDANGHLWIVSAASGKCRRDFPAHEGAINAAAVSPDGSWMVTGGADGTAGIWDWETGKQLRRLGGTAEITAVVPDARWLAVGAGDGIAQIWDPETGRLLHRLRCEGPVTTMAAAGKTLVTGTSTGTIKLWDPRTGRPLTMMRTGEPIHDCRWFDDDRGLLVRTVQSTYAYRLT